MASKKVILSVLASAVVLVLVAVGVGLGVYFYTKSLCDEDTTDKPETTTATTMSTMTTTTSAPDGGRGQRLPTNFYPTHYVLALKVYLPSPGGPTYAAEKNFTFDGDVTIHITCVEDTDTITLNSLELAYEEGSFLLMHEDSNTTAASLMSIDLQTEKQFALFKLDTTLKANASYRLSVKYTTHLKEDLASFYKADYKENGMERWMAVTQFQDIDARRALPCFDEPAYKAAFDVTIVHPSDLKALSNGPETPTDVGEKWTSTKFGRSPYMSTYLLAFAVGDFENGGTAVATNTTAQVKFRVWSRPELTPKTKYATSAGPFVLGFFEKYFGVEFPLKKQDMLAIPKFAFGAMENWGLVTYREKDLLYDERITSPRLKERVAKIIAHELAHMWFGDLVTMAWWDDLWLNEAFAEFLSSRGADEISLYTFGQEEQWPVKPLQVGLWSDQWPSSLAIGSGQALSAITYRKGASVLQMLNRTIGGEVLQSALTTYLKKHQYDNARSQDLYDELQIEVDNSKLPGVDGMGFLNVTDVMNRYVQQPGFPVVTVTDTKPGEITVEQERFLMVLKSDLPPFTPENRWHIPLFATGASNSAVSMMWVDGNAMKAVLNSSLFAVDSWYLLNAEGLGVYRINYPEANWRALTAVLLKNPLDLHMRPKAQLIDDAFALAWTNRLNYTVLFDLISYLRQERSYVPWQSAFNALEELGSVLAQTSEYNTYRQFVTWLLADGYGRWKNPDFVNGDDILLLQHNYQYLMTKIACLLNKEECVKEQLQIFSNYQTACANDMSSSECNKIDPNTRSVVYCSAVRLMGGPAFTFLLDKYEQDIDYQERTNLIDGLSCAKEPWLINKLLHAMAYGPIVVSQRIFIYRNLKTNPFAPRLAWAFLTDNWNRTDAIHNYEFTMTATNYMSTEDDFEQVSNFIPMVDDEKIAFTLRGQLQRIRSNISWRKMAMPTVLRLMKEKIMSADKPETTTTTTTTTTSTSMMTTTTSAPDSGRGPRLPTNFYPTHYNLALKVYLPSPGGPTYAAEKNFTFDGDVTIHITCVEDTDTITLNSLELAYEEGSFSLMHEDSNTTAASLMSIDLQTEKQFALFKLDTTLKANASYRLSVKYTTHLKDDLASFYKADYKENGLERWMAVTQFEDIDARRALPCFDEPAYKAAFDVTIVHPSDLKALSNGPETPTDMGDKWTSTKFGRSPYMSTYLLAFAVGDFENGGTAVATNTTAQVKFRVWSRPELTPKTKYATSAGPFVLGFFEKYFGVEFPLKKQDMLAIPKFDSGAMENWGLVTYRETYLLYDERITSPRLKERVAKVVAHELAHMWFGDLVTMAWWDDLWLNEAFAEFLSLRGADEISLYTFGQEEQWPLTPLQVGLWSDQWPSSLAIGSGQALSAITYRKGASVLQMLNRTIGGELLQRALTTYLKKHQYDNARSQDLYDELQIEVDNSKLPGVDGMGFLNVTDVMNRYVQQPFFPVVTVADTKPGEITVEQERFLMVQKSDLPLSNPKYRWHIPLFAMGASDSSVSMFWVDGNAMKTVLNSSLFAVDSWYLLNAEGLGVYRINYPEANWRALTAVLLKNPLDLHMRSKAQLIDDAFALAWTNRLNYTVLFDLISYLRQERSYVPWQSAFNALEELGSVLAQTSEYNTYREFLTWLLADGYGRWNKPDLATGDNILLLQQNYQYLMTKIACLLNKEECVKEQLRIFFIYQNACATDMSSSECNGIDANTRSVVYCSAVRLMGGPAFTFLLDKYEQDVDYQERTHLIEGLSCAKEPWLINKLLHAMAYGPIVVSQRIFIYRNLKTNPFAPRLAWAFLTDNWNRTDTIHNYEFTMTATNYMSTEDDYEQVSNFIPMVDDEKIAFTLRGQLQRIRSNISWRKMAMPTVLRLMKEKVMSGV